MPRPVNKAIEVNGLALVGLNNDTQDPSNDYLGGSGNSNRRDVTDDIDGTTHMAARLAHVASSKAAEFSISISNCRWRESNRPARDQRPLTG